MTASATPAQTPAAALLPPQNWPLKTVQLQNHSFRPPTLPLGPSSFHLPCFSQWPNSLTCLLIFYFLIYLAWDLLARHFILACVLILYTPLTLPLHLALWQNPNSGLILLSAFSMPLSKEPSILLEKITQQRIRVALLFLITTTQRSLWHC